MDNINFPKIFPLLSATAGIKRVKRRKDQNQRRPFQKALQEENKKKKKQKEEEDHNRLEGSSDTSAVESAGEYRDSELVVHTVDEDDAGRHHMRDEKNPKKLIDVHV